MTDNEFTECPACHPERFHFNRTAAATAFFLRNSMDSKLPEPELMLYLSDAEAIARSEGGFLTGGFMDNDSGRVKEVVELLLGLHPRQAEWDAMFTRQRGRWGWELAIKQDPGVGALSRYMCHILATVLFRAPNADDLAVRESINPAIKALRERVDSPK